MAKKVGSPIKTTEDGCEVKRQIVVKKDGSTKVRTTIKVPEEA